MTSPKAATTTRAGRTYTIELDDETLTVPSVTTVLGNLAKPGLTWWAAGEVATYVMTYPRPALALIDDARARVVLDGVHDCKACGQATDRPVADKDWWMHEDCERAWKELRKQPFVKREAKANLGSYVHGIVERVTLGETVDPAAFGEVAGHVATFLRFVDRHEPSFQMSEATVFSAKHGYAGTLDMIVDVGGKRWLVDVKTGGAYPDAVLQMAAYRYAESVYMAPKVIEPMPEVDDAAVLVVTEAAYRFVPATELHPDGAGERAFETFRHLLGVHEWNREAS